MTIQDNTRGPPVEQPVGSLTGLTPEAAKEFHRIFMISFILFTIVAIIAHVLVWMWRPWLPGPEGYSSIEGAVQMASALLAPAFG